MDSFPLIRIFTAFIVGTFSKSLGSVGGFCVSRHPQLEYMRYNARPYIFTASPAPSVIASTRVALQILRDGQDLRERLWRSANRLYSALQEAGFRLGPEPSPVIAIQVDSTEQALIWWKQLLEQGVYVNLVLPPATPTGGPLLRCSLSAAHTDAQIEQLKVALCGLRTAEACVLIEETLKSLEQEFADRFIRIHRNALVAVQYLCGLEKAANGHFSVQLQGIEERLEVSRRHIAGVRQRIRMLQD